MQSSTSWAILHGFPTILKTSFQMCGCVWASLSPNQTKTKARILPNSIPKSQKSISQMYPNPPLHGSFWGQNRPFSGAWPPNAEKSPKGNESAGAGSFPGVTFWEPFWSLWAPGRTLGGILGAFWARQATRPKQSAKNIGKRCPREGRSRPKGIILETFWHQKSDRNQ